MSQQPYQRPATPAPAPVSPPAKRRRVLPWILGGVAVVLLLCGGLAALGAVLASGDDTPAAGEATGTKPTTAAAAAPKAADFKLTAKITEQTCYGEAGCAVTWLPVVTYSGPAIGDGQTWVVSYEVSGLESGTTVGQIVMGSPGPAKQTAKHARTKAKDSKITLKVTGVERG